jgi:hypothetical protein
LPALVRVLENGGVVMIVANAPEDMTDAAAYQTLAGLVAQFPDRMAVVLAVEVFQHGKVYYVCDQDGREVAYVGSANLTGAGLERNHETGVAFSNGEPVIRQAAESVTAWWGHPAARWLDAGYLPGQAVRAEGAADDWPTVPACLRPGDRVTVGGRLGVVVASDRAGPADTVTVAMDGDDAPPTELSALRAPPQVDCPICDALPGEPCQYQTGGVRPHPHYRREELEAEQWLHERLSSSQAPEGSILPPPDMWEAAGREEGIRGQHCLRCEAESGSPCRNEAGGETAEHRERVTLALRARGRNDIAARCGGHTKRGRLCREEPLPDDIYCRTHRDKAKRGLPV